MACPRGIPNGAGAGGGEAVGPGTPPRWLGRRVWFYNGQRNGRAFGSAAEFIELAADINSGLPCYVVSRVTDVLNGHGKAVKGSKILIVGVAYKRDVSDMRESPAIDVVELLHHKGAALSYVDPYVPVFEEGSMRLESLPIDADASQFDLVIIVTDHTDFDYARLVSSAKVIFDTRNATRVVTGVPKNHVYRL